LCGVSPLRKGEEKTKLVIDHDHNVSPKKARGKLCYRCNSGLGFIEYMLDSNALEMAVAYVTTHGFEKPSIWSDPQEMERQGREAIASHFQ